MALALALVTDMIYESLHYLCQGQAPRYGGFSLPLLGAREKEGKLVSVLVFPHLQIYIFRPISGKDSLLSHPTRLGEEKLYRQIGLPYYLGEEKPCPGEYKVIPSFVNERHNYKIQVLLFIKAEGAG